MVGHGSYGARLPEAKSSQTITRKTSTLPKNMAAAKKSEDWKIKVGYIWYQHCFSIKFKVSINTKKIIYFTFFIKKWKYTFENNGNQLHLVNGKSNSKVGIRSKFSSQLSTADLHQTYNQSTHYNENIEYWSINQYCSINQFWLIDPLLAKGIDFQI